MSEDQKKKAWKTILKNYKNGKIFYKEYKSRSFAMICFLFDEIGEISCKNTQKILPPNYKIFENNYALKERILKLYELRLVLSQINNLYLNNISFICSGKNGLPTFMGRDASSPNEIIHIHLPPLNQQFIRSILKYFVYQKNNEFGNLLKEKFHRYACLSR